MHRNLFQKLVDSHIVSGTPEKGREIGLRIDQTLTQDALGTMAYLQFESMGISPVKTKLSVSYVDHLTLQVGYENSDDHRYLKTVADKHGIMFSKPGNGICHQIHLERFSHPGSTLLGGDSHTPTCGAVGMLAIGAGGSDVAVAMAGGAVFSDLSESHTDKFTGSNAALGSGQRYHPRIAKKNDDPGQCEFGY